MSKDQTCSSCKFRFAQFRPFPVTLVSLILYIPLIAVILWIHYLPPKAPSTSSVEKSLGINLTETWHNLGAITNQYHPYNSRANDHVRQFLLDEIKTIIDRNGVGGIRAEIINDRETNVIFPQGRLSIYFESLNIIVVVHGREDLKGKVLVNAHFDSVSTAPGTTDDGVGVVTLLALIDYFTQEDHTPYRSLVFLINDGEEDYLNGAVSYAHHDLAASTRTFFNLEGAGAGGRATLFRSSDAEITKFYKGAKHPFGSSLSGDGFKLRVIKSETDYLIFDGDMGLRGMDVAFWQPRARYHTQFDNDAHSSIDSVWHMLGQALDTVKGMSEDKTDDDALEGRTAPGVWFDILGDSFGVFRLPTIFALTMCLLTITPVLLGAVVFILFQRKKLYLFSKAGKDATGSPLVPLSGWKGFFRYPIAFILATGIVSAIAYLIYKVNPMIAYSSTEAIWSCLLSLWFVVAWTSLNAAAVWRPSASHKIWTLSWQWFGWWLMLIAVAVAQDRYEIGGLYFLLTFYGGVFVALIISIVGLFTLPAKDELIASIREHDNEIEDNDDRSQLAGLVGHRNDDDDDEPSEQTPLFGRSRRNIGGSSTSRASITGSDSCSRGKECSKRPYKNEQYWGKYLPKYTWIAEMLFNIPVPLIFTAPIGLLIGTAIAQVGADGGNEAMFTAYFMYTFFSIILLVPLAPFFHRITFHIPAFLFCVFVGTLLYSLLAFPFSVNAPLKIYFQQTVNATTNVNSVHLMGIKKYVRDIAKHDVPSAWGKHVSCIDDTRRVGLTKCSWEGLMPNVLKHYNGDIPVNTTVAQTWMSVNVTKSRDDVDSIHFDINGLESRACKIHFDQRIIDIQVLPLGPDGNTTLVRHNKPPVRDGGVHDVRLWARDFSRGWSVDVKFQHDDAEHKDSVDSLKGDDQDKAKRNKKTGTVTCMWSDANDAEVIPALTEVKAYFPDWAVVTKSDDGLVDVVVDFEVEV